MSWLARAPESRWYDVAQICLNGHVINSMVKAQPEHNADFCDKCGQAAITNCQQCQKEIRGYYHIPRVSGHGYAKPAFCVACGSPFPWTESKLKAAKELSDELDLSIEDISKLKESLGDLVKDTPKTTVAATRFKKIMSKAGKSAGDGFRKILIDVITEAAKKIIWPSP